MHSIATPIHCIHIPPSAGSEGACNGLCFWVETLPSLTCPFHSCWDLSSSHAWLPTGQSLHPFTNTECERHWLALGPAGSSSPNKDLLNRSLLQCSSLSPGPHDLLSVCHCASLLTNPSSSSEPPQPHTPGQRSTMAPVGCCCPPCANLVPHMTPGCLREAS